MHGDLDGLQLSAGASYVGQKLRGGQMSAGFNYARKVLGFQASAGANVAKYAEGLQLSIVNVGQDVDGLQLGLVNIGGQVRGMQLGLLNLAQDADAQLGMLNFSHRHGAGFEAWTSTTALLSVAARMEAGHTYGLAVAGLHPFGDDDGYLLGLGLGFKVPMNARLTVDIDETFYTVQYDYGGVPFDGERSRIFETRALLRITMSRRMDLFAGPTFTVLRQTGADDRGRHFGYGYDVYRSGEVTLWPGLAAGVHLH